MSTSTNADASAPATTATADRRSGDATTPAPDSGRLRRLTLAGVLAVLVASVVLRFWTRSPLWLDEAQSVAIARLPLSGHGTTIWTGLRQDGSPPLYYLMLHAWIRAFGTSDLAVRSLSGVLGLVAFPLLWRLARSFGDRRAALTAVLLFATSPFAVRYATETRMYSLLVVLTLIGALALRRLLLRGPAPFPLVVLALSAGALALTHYWSFYLLLVVGVGLAVLAVRTPGAAANRYRWALGAELAGAIVFVPWLPEFAYQLRHTGTPWGTPAGPSVIVHAFGEWAGGATAEGRLLLVVFAILLVFAAFGTPVDGRRVVLDLRGRDPGRALLGLTITILLVAVAAGQLTGTAWADRYTATAFVPFLIVAGLGVQALASTRIAVGIVAVACALGLVASASNITTDRTSAATVAQLIDATARPGDVVLTCPDQLGPALSRLVRPGIPVLGVPTLQPSARVDWVDYAARQAAADPATIAATAVRMAGPDGSIFLAETGTYRTYVTLCPAVAAQLALLRPGGRVLHADSLATFEHEGLLQYTPSRHTSP